MDAAQHSDTDDAELCAPQEGRKASQEGHFLSLTNDTSVFCNRLASPGQEIWSLMETFECPNDINKLFCLNLFINRKYKQ